jgi:iron-sulfur cluster insertion protein
MITITENAVKEIEMGLAENNEPYLRISVQGGGCSGFQYTFDFEQTKNEDDMEFGKVLIDSMSMMYLDSATVDYVEDLMGAQFTIKNPNAQTTCGCGSSFSV